MKFSHTAALIGVFFLCFPHQKSSAQTNSAELMDHGLAFLGQTAPPTNALADPSQVEISVSRLLEQGHYTRQKLEEIGPKKILESYLRILDPNRLYFTQQDIDSFFHKYEPHLVNAILSGNLVPARKIYAVFKKRVEDRIAKNKLLLKQSFAFNTHETILLNREKAPWPADEAAADKLWNSWLQAQVLQERLGEGLLAKVSPSPLPSSSPSPQVQQRQGQASSPSPLTTSTPLPSLPEKPLLDHSDQSKNDPLQSLAVKKELSADDLARLHPPKTPEETVARRFDSVLRELDDEKDFDVVAKFLSAVSQSYDPHSEYMSPEKMENFAISMKLSLVGVGAVLRDVDGYTRVTDVIPGGPADKEGQLKVNDRIIAVAQENGPFEDVVNMNLEKVVGLIRGKKGTIVRLRVIPGDSTDGSKRKDIEIKRDEVKLKDQQAKAEVIDLKEKDGNTTRIGWITLPSFYANIDPRATGPQANTTRDVVLLLKRLQQEKIQGLVMDLRKNGGGSLQEAINLTGLFVPRGPVVQVKDNTGRISVSYCEDAKNLYKGPLIVLVNHLSASASEIFAAALQDYGRAVIVGDSRTFCKGTVQTVLDVGRFMPFFSLAAAEAGSLKLTIQKFYRIEGGSTQLEGVVPNIILPSFYDNPQIGEGALPNALPYDKVPAVAFKRFPENLFIPQLQKYSESRVAADPDFAYIREEMKRIGKRLEDNNRVSLNEEERKAELKESKARQTKFEKERAARGPNINITEYSVTLDNIHEPHLDLVKYDNKKRGSDLLVEDTSDTDSTTASKPGYDTVKNETLRIMKDLIDFTAAEKHAETPTPSAMPH